MSKTSKSSVILAFQLGFGVGFAAAYFSDKQQGKRRFNTLRDQNAAQLRRSKRNVMRKVEYKKGALRGMAHKVAPHGHSHNAEDFDDVELAHKVETEIFRPENAPKGQVSVNAEHGVVYLRGTIGDQYWIEKLGVEAGKVQGVKMVKNLLH